MKGKVALLAGAAIGYVLGTRAGRERYEQMKAQARRLLQDPTVRRRVTETEDAVRRKAPEVQQKIADVASKTAHAARERTGGEHAET